MSKIRLIAFDLDGVLIDGCASWKAVHQGLGTTEKAKEHSKKFYSGRITFNEWAQLDSELWHGTAIERIKEILGQTRIMPGAKEALSQLRKRYKTAIISGGLQILADRIQKILEIDYAFANQLKVMDGKVCGIDHIVDFKGKGKILEDICKAEGISVKESAVIGDFINDISMFQIAGLRIAFNPQDEEIIRIADEVIYEKDLRRILPFFE